MKKTEFVDADNTPRPKQGDRHRVDPKTGMARTKGRPFVYLDELNEILINNQFETPISVFTVCCSKDIRRAAAKIAMERR